MLIAKPGASVGLKSASWIFLMNTSSKHLAEDSDSFTNLLVAKHQGIAQILAETVIGFSVISMLGITF